MRGAEMFLEYLSDDTTLESLMEDVKGLEVDVPEEDDYNPVTWPEIKTKRFISTYEKIKGRDGLWQLSFNNSLIYLIQFNIDFDSKSENAYNNCMDICKAIIKINNLTRGMNESLTGDYRRTYLEFKSEVMSDRGIPHGHYVQFAHYTWESSIKSAYLTAGCIWPDSMTVEYREEPVL
jgi:hypothetical protein